MVDTDANSEDSCTFEPSGLNRVSFDERSGSGPPPGRRTGRAYETPVNLSRTSDGVRIALTHGGQRLAKSVLPLTAAICSPEARSCC